MARTRSTRKWSGKVTETSDALDLEPRVFRGQDPKRIASSLKRSALRSRRRKASPFQSAMSVLNFYINRAGKICRQHRSGRLRRPRLNCAASSGATAT